MEELIKILEKFDTIRDFYKSDASKAWNEDAVAKCFEPCAREILCGGYFRVNEKHIIDLGSIELYYHEEEGNIKDHIMYHTNEKGSYSNYYKNKNLPYFILGSFNLHTSGVDVTFESEKNKYRASFLIRTYRVLDNEKEIGSDKKYDTCSTHIYDDLFPKGFFFGNHRDFKIEWIPYSKGGDVKQCKRINVPKYEIKYDKNKEVKYEKSEKEETRNWRFERIVNKNQ